MEDLEKVIEDLIAKRKATSQQVKDEVDTKPEVSFANGSFSSNDVIKSVSKNYLDLKNEIITHLNNAKMSHKKWMSYVQILIRLADIESANDSIPINYTLCDFGKWYYGKGQKLNKFEEYTQMEEVHKSVHDTYLQIYELYLRPIKGSLFNSEKKQIQQRDKKAIALSKILDEYSKIMYDLLILVENRINSLSEVEFTQMVK